MDVISDSLFTMLQLQRALNERGNKDWYNTPPPFLRKAIIAAAHMLEQLDRLPQQDNAPDWIELQKGMAQLLPPLLSFEMINQGRRDEELVKIAYHLETIYAAAQRNDLFSGEELAAKMEIFIGKAALREPLMIWQVYFSALKDARLDWHTLSRSYFSENVLSLFRKDYGDETGDYTSNWGGKDDSVHVAEIMANMERLDLAAIRHALVLRYSTLTGRRATDKKK